MILPAPDYARNQVGWTPAIQQCGAAIEQLGMLDTLADLSLPLLSPATITQALFLDEPDATPADPTHGSTVASILAGQGGFGLLPNASLSIAGIFTIDEDGAPIASATAFVGGLNWLAERGVTVVNTSLSGPANEFMELAIQAAVQRDIRIVAAVGNDGLHQVPRYPAAYPGVIGVTAVDVAEQPFKQANSGSFVTFAAPGVDLWVPSANEFRLASQAGTPDGSYVSGTSFAAPFVAAALATNGNDSDALARSALDLGDKGRDPVFGFGLIQASATCSPAAD